MNKTIIKMNNVNYKQKMQIQCKSQVRIKTDMDITTLQIFQT